MTSIALSDRGNERAGSTMMIIIVGVTVALGLLFLSAAEPATTPDGAIEWREESLLRAVVKLLCLNYQVPTVFPGDVKSYIFGLGAGLALLVAGVAAWRVRGPAGAAGNGLAGHDAEGTSEAMPEAPDAKPHVAPLLAAQILAVLFLLWSLASSRWSGAPSMSLGGSAILAIHIGWALALGNGLGSAGAALATRVVMGAIGLTAAVAVWYHYGRNPTLRADFPVGNPTFVAACMLPGIVWGAAHLGQAVGDFRASRQVYVPGVLGSGLVLALCVWAFVLADARGAYVGLAVALLTIGCFTFTDRRRWIPAFLVVAVVAAAVLYVSRAGTIASPTGRDVTARFRLYAWSYAWRMFTERPLLGHGQGAFARLSDSYVLQDVADDPLVFTSRVAHAHSEWLEVMSDLGAVGIVLIGAVLLLTVNSGANTLRSSTRSPGRWVPVGALSSIVGLAVEEFFGVGLRTSAVPIVFYTLLGLAWAASTDGASGLTAIPAGGRWRAGLGRSLTVLSAVGVFWVAHYDFSGARRAHQAQTLFEQGDYDGAIQLAEASIHQFNPDRALMNLYRLSEANILVAESLQGRAFERRQRAWESDPPNPRVLALAEDDIRLSDEHCEKGIRALKALVIRSPAYLNQGLLEYRLEVVRARSAAVRGDTAKQQALETAAAVAIQRELARQPFDPVIGMESLTFLGPAVGLLDIMNTMARPLRHHAITERYMQVLRRLSADPEFSAQWSPLLEAAVRAVTEPATVSSPPRSEELWAPEKLRLTAAMHFVRGEFQAGRDLLEKAAATYATIAASAPVGAASCFAELAICRFFSDPLRPEPAIQASERAISLAPRSGVGRELTRGVKARLVGYYLAAGDEDRGRALLRGTAPPRAAADVLERELGVRYRDLCDSLMKTAAPDGVIRTPAPELAEHLHRWIGRARTLNPADTRACWIAAEMAFAAGDDAVTVAHLRSARDVGLPGDQLREFVRFARESRPDSEPLQAFERTLATPENGTVPGGLETPPAEPTSPADAQAPP